MKSNIKNAKVVRKLEKQWQKLSPQDKCKWNGFKGYCERKYYQDSSAFRNNKNYRLRR
jgi:hypothetical protein